MESKKLILGLVAGLLFGIHAMAGEDAPAPMIINIADRSSVSLDGQWKYLVDQYGIGYYNYRLMPQPDKDSFFADKSFDDDRTKLIEYSFDRGGEMRVPGDWNTQYEKLYYYEGKVWYRTKFDAAPSPEKRYFLYFGAVNHTAIVGLNGNKIARHEGGFTPFNVEVTGRLKEKDNSLVVLVDNTRDKDGIPTNNCDWWNYGGITRSVKLVEVPGTFIRDYAVLMDKAVVGKVRKNKPAKHRIYGYVNLDGSAAAGQEVSISVPELKLSVKAVADDNGHAVFESVAAPQLWSPDSPKLYDVEISSAQDKTRDKVGFRIIETAGDKILLNGKEIFLRGISVHEESTTPVGRITSASQNRELLDYAKELGCNFVRLAHYPHNEDIVRQAEEMGLLVWSEIPVYWTISWNNPDTYANARQQLEEMVTRDINRANIIIWSVANETPISPERTRFLAGLISRAREMDSTRLVSAAMEKVAVSKNHYTVDDPLLEYTDLISFNQYTGWYGSKSEQCDNTYWEFPVLKPVFISEFGAGALYGNHGPKTERFTEEYMADCYERNIRMMVERMPGFAGTSPWILKDFRSPRRALNGIQDDYNRKGVLSEDGHRKQAWYVLRDWYMDLKARNNE
ncbi:MAG: beta-glucuronidase [Bacteroidales bacterium]|nr:beta-glucuronidase [Bacteroidales bacterium]